VALNKNGTNGFDYPRGILCYPQDRQRQRPYILTSSSKPKRASRMSTGPSDFKISNVRRAIAGAEKAGIVVGRIEVKTDGTVAIIPAGKEPQVKTEPSAVGALKQWDD